GGAETLKKYKASKATISGEMSLAGMNMTFTGTTANEFPSKFRLNLETSIMGQKLEVLQIVSGEKVKNQVKFGAMDVSPPAEQSDELKNSVVIQNMSQIYPLLDDKKFTLKAEPDGDVDGKKVAVVK